MNWRASLTAAVIVLAGGVATGAILGASKTKTHTVTRIVRASGSPGTSAPSTTDTTPTVARPAAPRVSLKSVPRQVNNIDPNEVTTPALTTLNGTQYQNSIVLDHLFTDCAGTAPTSGKAWITFPVSSGLARFTGTLGLNTAGGKTEPAFSMTVEARANSVGGPVLRKPHTYQGTGTVETVKFPLQGARKLLFVFRGQHPDVCSAEPGSANPRESEFVFADATLAR